MGRDLSGYSVIADYIEAYTTDPPDPYRSLVAAVIARAVMDRELSNRQIARPAREWLDSTDRSPWSFLWACSILGLAPKKVKALSFALIARTPRSYGRIT